MDNAATNDDELTGILTDLWDHSIIPLYEKGKIQTERHLQAYLFMLLKNRFVEKVLEEWDVWIEPHFYFKDDSKKPNGEKMYKPDIVITKDHELAGILELKFTPQEGKWENNRDAAYRDFEKLVLYSQGISKYPNENTGYEFLLELNPKSGAYDTSNPKIRYKRDSEVAKYFFLGIAWFDGFNLEEALREKANKEGLKSKFMPLVYPTHRDDNKRKA